VKFAKLVFVCLIALFGFSFVLGNPVNKETSVIRAQQEMAATIVAQDWKSLDRMLTDDAVYVHSFGRVDTKSDLLKNIARFKSIHQWEYRDVSVRMYRGAAVISANLYVRLALPDGAEQSSQQRITETWIKQAGIWRLASHQSTGFKD
jgi:ketosteroid isomerase-like protein